MLHHERITHMSLPIWSDIGGFAFVIYILVGVFMFPISERLFLMEAIELLFLARTKESNMFPNSKRF